MSAVSSRKLARYVSHAVLDILCFTAPWDKHMQAFSLDNPAQSVHGTGTSAMQDTGLHDSPVEFAPR
jgi:hypothetical protein